MAVSGDGGPQPPFLAGLVVNAVEDDAIRRLAHQLARELAAKSATDVRLLEIAPISTIADYFVLATANSRLHMRGLVDTCHEMAPEGSRPRVEGRTDDGWVLVDCGDLIVHLFLPDPRRYYAIEELWGDARTVLHLV